MTVMPASADSFVLIWRLDMTIASGIFCISIAAGVSTTGARGFRSLVIAAGSKWSGWMSVTRMRSAGLDRKSTRLNSSHRTISYAVFCLNKKKKNNRDYKDDERSAGKFEGG